MLLSADASHDFILRDARDNFLIVLELYRDVPCPLTFECCALDLTYVV